jgi:hypothetical protein
MGRSSCTLSNMGNATWLHLTYHSCPHLEAEIHVYGWSMTLIMAADSRTINGSRALLLLHTSEFNASALYPATCTTSPLLHSVAGGTILHLNIACGRQGPAQRPR